MDRSLPLLADRLSRRGICWLAAAVLIVTPLESLSRESIPSTLVLVVRAIALTALLVALWTEKIGAINAGRTFLGIGLADMVASAVVSESLPRGVVIEAIAYGTILPTFALLIAPSASRRRWSLAATAVVAMTAALRLLPGHEILLVQVIVVFVVHSTAVTALDVHASRAEAAGVMAAIDPLTGLLNRRPTIGRLTNALVDLTETGRESTVVMIDLDRFKQVNDTLGHEAGDDALQRVADALSHLVREGDVLCRWGGEEFLVLLPGAEFDTATLAAERMRVAIERLGVTASFGVAQALHHNTVAEWVDRADAAMYLAKRNGRNRIVVDDRFRSEI